MFFWQLPRDLLLVLRTNNLVRSINRDLGGKTSFRYKKFAEYAIKGIYYPGPQIIPHQHHQEAKYQPDLHYQELTKTQRTWKWIQFHTSITRMHVHLWFSEILYKFMLYWKNDDLDRITPTRFGDGK